MPITPNGSPLPESAAALIAGLEGKSRAGRIIKGAGHAAGAIAHAGEIIDSRGRRWNSALHPRDANGRFIETGGVASIPALGVRGKVVRALGNDRIELRLPDGRRKAYPSRQLIMVARPDGSKPITAPKDENSDAFKKAIKKINDEDARRLENPKRGDGVGADDEGDWDGDGILNEKDDTPLGEKKPAPGKKRKGGKDVGHGYTLHSKPEGGESADTNHTLEDEHGNVVGTATSGVSGWKGQVGGQKVDARNEQGWVLAAQRTHARQETHRSNSDYAEAARSSTAPTIHGHGAADRPIPRDKNDTWDDDLVQRAAKRQMMAARAAHPNDPAAALREADQRQLEQVSAEDSRSRRIARELAKLISAERAKKAPARKPKNEVTDAHREERNQLGEPGRVAYDLARHDGKNHVTAMQEGEAADRTRRAVKGDAPDAPARDEHSAPDAPDAGSGEPADSRAVAFRKENEASAARAEQNKRDEIDKHNRAVDAVRDDSDPQVQDAIRRYDDANEDNLLAKRKAARDVQRAVAEKGKDGAPDRGDDENERTRTGRPETDKADAPKREHAAAAPSERQSITAKVRDNETTTPKGESSDRAAAEPGEDRRGPLEADAPAGVGVVDPEREAGVLRQPRAAGDGERGRDDAAGRADAPGGDDRGSDAPLGDGPLDSGAERDQGVLPAGAADGTDGPEPDRGSSGAGAARTGLLTPVREDHPDAPKFRPTTQNDNLGGSKKARAQANIEALKTLRELDESGEPATPEQQAKLAKWSGWGALSEAMWGEGHAKEFAPERAELDKLLSPEEQLAARRNTLNAHYTDTSLVKNIWDGLQSLGFDGGQVLEPGSGSGNFIGFAPDDADMVGVEMEGVTAKIAHHLYPDATIVNKPLEDFSVPEGVFDAAIGNVPFSKVGPFDKVHNPKRQHNLHDFAILKSLRQVRPGGVAAFITSSRTLDNQSSRSREAMYDEADLIGAVRLPNGTHKGAADTDVLTDVLFFRKRMPGEAPGDDKWVRAAVIGGDDDNKITRNGYYTDHPGQVLGEPTIEMGQFGPEMRVKSDGRPVASAMRDAIGRMVADAESRGLVGAPRRDEDAELAGKVSDILASSLPAHREGSLSFIDGKFVTQSGGRHVPAAVPKTQAAKIKRLLEMRDVADELLTLESASDAMLDADGKPTDTKATAALRKKLNDLYDKHIKASKGQPINDSYLKKSISDAKHDEPYQALTGDLMFGNIIELPGEYDGRGKTRRAVVDGFEDDGRVRLNVIGAKTEREKVRHLVPDDMQTHIVTGQRTTNYSPKRNLPSAFEQDPRAGLVINLENYDVETNTATKGALLLGRKLTSRKALENVEDPETALSMVLDGDGELTLAKVAKVMGVPEKDARVKLKGHIFQDPEAGDAWVSREAYLSGDLRQKLAAAEERAAKDPAFKENVEVLKERVPSWISVDRVKPKMGASWIPDEDLRQFVAELVDDPNVKISRSEHGGWEVKGTRADHDSLVGGTWGTINGTYELTDENGQPRLNINGEPMRRPFPGRGRSAYEIAEAILNHTKMKVTYTSDGKKYVDEKGTEAAQQKAKEMRERFEAWLWEDGDRRTRLIDKYNDMFNSLVKREYSSAPMKPEGLSESFTLYPHQASAIRRMLNEPATLIAHEVGAGKTLEMASAAMELRRRGLAKKPMIVVPNHMKEQWRREFLDAYPQAKVLAVSTDDLKTPAARRSYLARVATGDWDAVIITHSTFGGINLSDDTLRSYIDKELAERREELAGMIANGADAKTIKKVEEALLAKEQRLKQKLSKDGDSGITFEQLGVDYLMVDEAHEFKNLDRTSSTDEAIDGSGKATDLHAKLDYLQSTSKSGRYVTFATATPVANSFGETHTMLKYLRPDLLKKAGVGSFDGFLSNFANVEENFEMSAAGGTFEMKQRIGSFSNGPGLFRLWQQVADVLTSEDLDLDVPDVDHGAPEMVLIKPSKWFTDEYQPRLIARAEAAKKRRMGEKGDNILVINADGKAAALDPRMVGGPADAGSSKIVAAAEKIKSIYDETSENQYRFPGTDQLHPNKGALQLVFLDQGVPGASQRYAKKLENAEAGGEDAEIFSDQQGFEAYEALKETLVAQGIPAEKIAFMHDAKGDSAKKAKLFAKASSGELAVLVGSTALMGVGTNVQHRAVALHHLDVPYRPSDLTQRNGRVIRQKNQNSKVRVLQYAVDGSLDSRLWNIQERKGKFIEQLMKGDLSLDEFEELSPTVMNAAEMRAHSSGNKDMLHLIETEKKLRDAEASKRSILATVEDAKKRIEQTDTIVPQLERRAEVLDGVMKRAELDKREKAPSKYMGKVGGKAFTKRADLNEAYRAGLRETVKTRATGASGNDDETFYVGHHGGLEVQARLHVDFISQRVSAEVFMPEVPAGRFQVEKGDIDNADVALRLDNLLDNLPHAKEVTERDIRNAIRNKENALPQLDRQVTPEDEARLKALSERHERLTALLAAQAKGGSKSDDHADSRGGDAPAKDVEVEDGAVEAHEIPDYLKKDSPEVEAVLGALDSDEQKAPPRPPASSMRNIDPETGLPMDRVNSHLRRKQAKEVAKAKSGQTAKASKPAGQQVNPKAGQPASAPQTRRMGADNTQVYQEVHGDVPGEVRERVLFNVSRDENGKDWNVFAVGSEEPLHRFGTRDEAEQWAEKAAATTKDATRPERKPAKVKVDTEDVAKDLSDLGLEMPAPAKADDAPAVPDAADDVDATPRMRKDTRNTQIVHDVPSEDGESVEEVTTHMVDMDGDQWAVWRGEGYQGDPVAKFATRDEAEAWAMRDAGATPEAPEAPESVKVPQEDVARDMADLGLDMPAAPTTAGDRAPDAPEPTKYKVGDFVAGELRFRKETAEADNLYGDGDPGFTLTGKNGVEVRDPARTLNELDNLLEVRDDEDYDEIGERARTKAIRDFRNKVQAQYPDARAEDARHPQPAPQRQDSTPPAPTAVGEVPPAPVDAPSKPDAAMPTDGDGLVESVNEGQLPGQTRIGGEHVRPELNEDFFLTQDAGAPAKPKPADEPAPVDLFGDAGAEAPVAPSERFGLPGDDLRKGLPGPLAQQLRHAAFQRRDTDEGTALELAANALNDRSKQSPARQAAALADDALLERAGTTREKVEGRIKAIEDLSQELRRRGVVAKTNKDGLREQGPELPEWLDEYVNGYREARAAVDADVAAADAPVKPEPAPKAAAADWKPVNRDMGPKHRQIIDPDSDRVLFDVEQDENGAWSVHPPTHSIGIGTMFGTRKEALAWAEKYAHLQRDRKELPDAEGNFFDDTPKAGDAAPEAPASAPAKPKKKGALDELTYHESYGDVTKRELRAIKKHNVSPADHRALTSEYGDDHDAIVAAITDEKNHTDGGSFSEYRWLNNPNHPANAGATPDGFDAGDGRDGGGTTPPAESADGDPFGLEAEIGKWNPDAAGSVKWGVLSTLSMKRGKKEGDPAAEALWQMGSLTLNGPDLAKSRKKGAEYASHDHDAQVNELEKLSAWLRERGETHLTDRADEFIAGYREARGSAASEEPQDGAALIDHERDNALLADMGIPDGEGARVPGDESADEPQDPDDLPDTAEDLNVVPDPEPVEHPAAAERLPGEKFDPTPQQQEVYDAALDGKDVVIQAKAGAGKTSTLEGLARRIELDNPDDRIAYVAFNKSVQVEAQGRMPKNVEPRTGHSIAFAWASDDLKERFDKRGLRRPDEIARHLGINEDMKVPGEKALSPKEQAMAVVRAIDTFANSAEDEISAKHLPERMHGLPTAEQDALVAYARKGWADLLDAKGGKLNLTLDHMRKMWALSKPDFTKAGSGLKRRATVLFLDEAQDTPPVLAKVIADQKMRKVIVGDADQAIYGFTGATDYLSTALSDVELPLTKSFRFGPQVADWGNRFLQLLGSKGRVEGAGPASKIVHDMQGADAILVRSNGGMIGELIRELENGRTVGVPKGTKKDLLSLVETARYLKGEGPMPERLHDDLAPFRTWAEVTAEAGRGDDAKLKMLTRIVGDHGVDKLDEIVQQVTELGDDGLSGVEFENMPHGLVARGKTFGIKDDLKAAGFRWAEVPGERIESGKNKGQPLKAWTATGDEATREARLARLREAKAGPTPDVVVSTAHKAKGLEWDRVKIGDDFQGPKTDPDTGAKIMPNADENRLAYVAVTRARKELDPGSLSWVEDYTDENGGAPGRKPHVKVDPEQVAKDLADTGADTSVLPERSLDAPETFEAPVDPGIAETPKVDAPEAPAAVEAPAGRDVQLDKRGRMGTQDLRVGDVIEAKRTDNGEHDEITVESIRQDGAHELVTGRDKDGNRVYARLNEWGAKLKQAAPEDAPKAWETEAAPESIGTKTGPTLPGDLHVGDLIDGKVKVNGRPVSGKFRITKDLGRQGFMHQFEVEDAKGEKHHMNLAKQRPVNVLERAPESFEGQSYDGLVKRYEDELGKGARGEAMDQDLIDRLDAEITSRDEARNDRVRNAAPADLSDAELEEAHTVAAHDGNLDRAAAIIEEMQARDDHAQAWGSPLRPAPASDAPAKTKAEQEREWLDELHRHNLAVLLPIYQRSGHPYADTATGEGGIELLQGLAEPDIKALLNGGSIPAIKASQMPEESTMALWGMTPRELAKGHRTSGVSIPGAIHKDDWLDDKRRGGSGLGDGDDPDRDGDRLHFGDPADLRDDELDTAVEHERGNRDEHRREDLLTEEVARDKQDEDERARNEKERESRREQDAADDEHVPEGDVQDYTDDELDDAIAEGEDDDEESRRARGEKFRRDQMGEDERKKEDEDRRRRRGRRRRRHRRNRHGGGHGGHGLPHLPHPNLPGNEPNHHDGHGDGRGDGRGDGHTGRVPGDKNAVEKHLDALDAGHNPDKAAKDAAGTSEKAGRDLTPEERERENAAMDAAFGDPAPDMDAFVAAEDRADDATPGSGTVGGATRDEIDGHDGNAAMFDAHLASQGEPVDGQRVKNAADLRDVLGEQDADALLTGRGVPGARLAEKLGPEDTYAIFGQTPEDLAAKGATPVRWAGSLTPEQIIRPHAHDAGRGDAPDASTVSAPTVDAPQSGSPAVALPSRAEAIANPDERGWSQPIKPADVKPGDVAILPNIKGAGVVERVTPTTQRGEPGAIIHTEAGNAGFVGESSPVRILADRAVDGSNPKVFKAQLEKLAESARATQDADAATGRAAARDLPEPDADGYYPPAGDPAEVPVGPYGMDEGQMHALVKMRLSDEPVMVTGVTKDGAPFMGEPKEVVRETGQVREGVVKFEGPNGEFVLAGPQVASMRLLSGEVAMPGEPVPADLLRPGSRAVAQNMGRASLSQGPGAKVEVDPDGSIHMATGRESGPGARALLGTAEKPRTMHPLERLVGAPSDVTPAPAPTGDAPEAEAPGRPSAVEPNAPDAPNAPAPVDAPDEVVPDPAAVEEERRKGAFTQPRGPVDPEAPAPADAPAEPVDDTRAPATVRPMDAVDDVPTATEPITGREADWVTPDALQIGDYARLDGMDSHGAPLTVAGYLANDPQPAQWQPADRRKPPIDVLGVLVSEEMDGLGQQTMVWVPLDRLAALAPRPEADDVVPQGEQFAKNKLDVRDGRMPNRIPVDSTGRLGLFPRSLVTDVDGQREGVVIAARKDDVSVRWGNGQVEDVAGHTLRITDGGIQRPDGWTAKGRRIEVADPARQAPIDVDNAVQESIFGEAADQTQRMVDALGKALDGSRPMTRAELERTLQGVVRRELAASQARRVQAARRIVSQRPYEAGLLTKVIAALGLLALSIAAALIATIMWLVSQSGRQFGRDMLDRAARIVGRRNRNLPEMERLNRLLGIADLPDSGGVAELDRMLR